ncbi:MAG TPA: cytochrome P450, partial [Micromonosporaceae bacterium]
ALSEVIFSLAGKSAVATARQEIESYLAGMIEARRKEPGGQDMLAALVAVRDQGDELTETELLNFALILLTVGHMSTANTLGTSLFMLLRRPELMQRLRDQPDDIPATVEELLRYNPFTLSGTQVRVATEDVELGGATIHAGEAVIASLGAANHDPAVFNSPEQLDPDRAENPHLAFGYGVHHCLGAQLARMELQVAIATLLRRLPGIPRLAVPEEWLTLKTGLTGHALTNLPVLW